MTDILSPRAGGADTQAEALRREILNAEDRLDITGTRYYISPNGDDANEGKTPETPFRTTERIRELDLQPGDAVLFERGGLWRVKSSVSLCGGVRYGAYGNGAKPVLYGSERNYAEKELWRREEGKPVWRIDLPTEEAGLIIFDRGRGAGVKKLTPSELNADGDFSHDVAGGVLYLYFEKGNPAEFYEDIEIGTTGSLFRAERVDDVAVDNICFQYAAVFAIDLAINKKIVITGCEMGWIGGRYANDEVIRYGNAVQFWCRCQDIRVENCWIYQIYDAAITFQGFGAAGAEFQNVTFARNLIEYCSMNIEYWAGSEQFPDGFMHDIMIEENILRFGGYGWCRQRPDLGDQAFILGWGRHYSMRDFTIRSNVFDCADCNIIWTLSPQNQQGLTVYGNTYYQKKASGLNPYTEIVRDSGMYAGNQAELEAAVKMFEPDPKLVEWLDH